MGSRTRRRALVIEGVKVLVLLGIFTLIQDQILGLRYDLYGGRTALAEGTALSRSDSRSNREAVESALQGCAYEISRARGELEESYAKLEEERADLIRLLDERTRDLEGSIIDRIDAERGELETTRFALETGTERLAEMQAKVWKDPREMKRRMILPTVQLKGNGTVGSGVLIYSEPQPDVDGSPRGVNTTFVLTAHHVVLEVMGDKVDAGTVDEVHVLTETDAESLDVFSAKVVLFDRARDVALLRLNTSRKFPNTALLLPRKDLAGVDVFARAYAVGCPLGNRPLPTLGEVSSKWKVVSDQVFWMLSAPTFFGNSGGGVYLADNCRLIGVSSMIYTYGKANPTVVPHMGLFVPLDTIYRWLDAEGYSFVHEGRPIPRELLWKLAFVESDATLPRNASGRETGE